jgi:integrase
LKALPEATIARNVVVDEAGIRALIREARAIGPELGLLIEALALTGVRVSQLARCQCRDLVGNADDARLMMPSSAKGLRKRASRTPVPIPADLADRLRTAFAGRAADSPLLVKPSGDEWRRSDHFRLFNRARNAASLPSDVTIYSLRHSHITTQLLAGLPVQLVSRLHDTSASQIEKHYAAEIASFGDAQVRAAMMNIDQPSGDVISLRR